MEFATMLSTALLHPEILRALGSLGHGSQILISDGNYPHATASHPDCARVFLNLAPGVVNCTDVLKALVPTIPIEAAHVMRTPDGAEAEIWPEYRALMPTVELQVTERFAFYEIARQPNVGLLIATADQRQCANLILTIGIVWAPSE